MTPSRLRTAARRTTLRSRVLAGVLAVVLIVMAGFGYAAVTALRGYLLARTDSELQGILNEYKPLLLSQSSLANGQVKVSPRHANRSSALTGPPLQLPAFLDQYYIEVEIGHRLKVLVQGDSDLVPRPTAGVADGAHTVTSANGQTQMRLLAAPVTGTETLIATTSLAGVNSTVSRIQLIVITGSLAAAAVIFAGVGLVVRRGLRPIEEMATAADKITAGDLVTRVSPHDRATEVGRLGAAINGMLARIQAAIREREASEEGTRRFFADASHELRTPLASLRANAELYQQGALPHGWQVDEAMRRIAIEARRMGALVDDMLRLARLDQHPRQNHQLVDLSGLAAECAERARIASPEHSWRTRIAPGLATAGDEEMLRRAIDNLLGNVPAHTPAGTVATITADARDGIITVEVSDTGPGVPASQLPRIFDRFYRAPAEAQRPGSGLGLAIVAAIAAAHHGTVQAAPNLPHGLRVTLTLPAPAAPSVPAGPGRRRVQHAR